MFSKVAPSLVAVSYLPGLYSLFKLTVPTTLTVHFLSVLYIVWQLNNRTDLLLTTSDNGGQSMLLGSRDQIISLTLSKL
jgi:hypothetical protein